MDTITQKIRDMYEQYSYPSGEPKIRLATDCRLVMSYIEEGRKNPGAINALDAGCGRGMGLIGCAVTQPDVNFLGIDINRIALKEATQLARQNNLKNVRFQECNLMTLDGLEVPDGGFDVIYSSGVLHHLSNPLEGLKKLKAILAPHGVIAFMVYGKVSRQPLYRMINAIKTLTKNSEEITPNIAISRELVKFANKDILCNTPWENTHLMSDIEFVDRCLNANETSYTIDELWNLLSEAGMKFIQWMNPSEWSIGNILPEGILRDNACQLPEQEQFKLVEQVCWKHKLELIISHEHNERRRPYGLVDFENTFFMVNPEVSFSVETRNFWKGQKITGLNYKLGVNDPETFPPGPFANAILALSKKSHPFSGGEWFRTMIQQGANQDLSKRLILELLSKNIIYRPHPSEL